MSAANRNKTELLITIGTPYVGSAKCLDVMEAGNLIQVPLIGDRIAQTVKTCCQNSYAAYQLLPTEKYANKTGKFAVKIYNGNSDGGSTQITDITFIQKNPAGPRKLMVL